MEVGGMGWGGVVCVSNSVVSDSVTPRTATCQVPLSMEFSRQEHWSGLPFQRWGDMANRNGINRVFHCGSLETLQCCSSVSSQVCWLSGKEPACQFRRCGFDPCVRKIPLEKEMATHASILAWEIPWTEEPGGLQSLRLQSQRRLERQQCSHDLCRERRALCSDRDAEGRGDLPCGKLLGNDGRGQGKLWGRRPSGAQSAR